MENMEYLKKGQIEFDLIELKENVHTVEDTAKFIGCEHSQILKSLLVQDALNKTKFALIVLLGIKKLDFKMINKVCGLKDTRFVKVEEVLSKTGFVVGTLPPWGYNEEIKIYYDKDILTQEKVFAGSGNPNYLIRFNPKLLINNINIFF